MARSTLKKILNQADVRAAVTSLHDSFNAAYLRVEDRGGTTLLQLGNADADGDFDASDRQPINAGGDRLGWVYGGAIAPPLAALLSCFARQELEKRSLARELLERYQELDLFYEISTQVTASLNLKTLSKLVLHEVENVLPLSSAAIWLLDRPATQLELLFQSGQPLPWANPLPLDDSLLGALVRQGRGEIINRVVEDRRATAADRSVSSLLCVPLLVQDRTLGAIAVTSQEPLTYSAEHLKLLTLFAVQTAIAIEKALIYEQSRTVATRAQQQAYQLQKALEDLRQAQTHLVQSEKMSSLGQMVAGVAHEINNPVNFINGNLSHARDYTQDLLDLVDLYGDRYPDPDPEIQAQIDDIDLDFLRDDLPKLLGSMQMGIDRIREIVSSLKNFSRLDRERPQPADLHAGLDSTLLILNNRIKAKGDRPEVRIVREYGDLPPVECFAGQLNQVFVNAIANAIEAMEEAEVPNPTLWLRTKTRGDRWAVIQIVDNGPGMNESVKQQIFDPFFTTKVPGKGTGLGLAISRQIVVERHGGKLDCRSQIGSGTEFEISVPLRAEPRDAVRPHLAKNDRPDSAIAGDRPIDEPTFLPSKTHLSPEELTRYQQLVDRLSHYNPDLRDFPPERIYHMLMSMPILLKLYLASLESPTLPLSD